MFSLFYTVMVTSLAYIPFAYSGEAPTGFDNKTNGFISQTDFDAAMAVFNEVETIEDGLGPIFNSDSCVQCHQSVVSGGSTQITELRSDGPRRDNKKGHSAVQSAGGTMIEARAIDASIVDFVGPDDEVQALRISPNILGEGFVEAVLDQTLLNIQSNQPNDMKGLAIQVPVLEAGSNVFRIGRFGWKSQHASLKSFAADAYLNEMGITNPLFPEENDSNRGSVAAFDTVADPEDDGVDVDIFTEFMRATKAPPRGPATQTTQVGQNLFNEAQCSVCHTPTLTTAPEGTSLNGGQFVVDASLGGKKIHPYSDFLLHDVGTGDGIPASSDHPETKNMIRTAPLWGLRTRNRLMHDGLSYTFDNAIQRHEGQARSSKNAFNALTDGQRAAILEFLGTL